VPASIASTAPRVCSWKSSTIFPNFAGGVACRLGQPSHFAGNDGKAASLLACARRLDGGVQSQQVGLLRNLLDHIHDANDLLALLAEALHR
jgi:hypothetical protein